MSLNLISIDGLNRADVLAALYNAAIPEGDREHLAKHDIDEDQMTRSQAEQILRDNKQHNILLIDFIDKRRIGADLTTRVLLNPAIYDKANGGTGTMERVINHLRDTGLVTAPPELADTSQV